MKKITVSLLLILALVTALLAGCGATGTSAPAEQAASAAGTSQPASVPATDGKVTTIVVGASPAPHAEILELVVPILKAEGIELKIKEFNDYITPNLAVSDGSLDANFFQHLPYLENYNAENGTDLVNAGGIHIEPLGVYPGKTASLDELADGATIAVPNDPTNEGRALALLEALGLIEIDPAAGLEAVPGDITKNPHNLKFVELEAAQLPVTLPDVDFAVINGNYAVEAGLGDSVLERESTDIPYVNVIAVRNGDENRPEIKALVAALQSDEVRTFIQERYNGVVVPVF